MVRRPRHGMARTRENHIWRQMRYRCSSPNAQEYKNYGGRGIKVCDRWSSFENFYADMGDCPPGLTLERVDGNKDYEPSNCVWDTYKVQQNNRRNNTRVTAFGRTQTLTQWAEEYNLPVTTLKNRLFRAKMAPEDALSAPLYAQQRKKRT